MALELINSFGATLLPSAVGIIDERHILYICGKYICLHNLSTSSDGASHDNVQQFIPGSKDGKQIKSLCISPSTSGRTKSIAFVESESSIRSLISIIPDWTNHSRRYKTPIAVDCQAIITISFSSDSKHLCALSRQTSTEYTLFIWNLDSSKLVAKQAAAIKIQNQGPLMHACFHMVDSSIVYVCGQGFFRVFKLQDQNVKSIPGAFGNKNLKNYTHMIWLSPSRMLVGCEDSNIYLIDSNELKGIAARIPDGNIPRLLAQHIKGFTAVIDGGVLYSFEHNTNSAAMAATQQMGSMLNEYQLMRTVTIDGCEILTTNLLQTNQSNMCIGTSKGQLLLADLSGGLSLLQKNKQGSSEGAVQEATTGLRSFSTITRPLYTSSCEIPSTEDTNEQPVIVIDLIPQWHRGAVIAECCSTKRPLAIVASTDKTVRAITFPLAQPERQLKLEFVSTFAGNDELTCIDLHPSGHFAIVGHQQKLALYNVVLDGLSIQQGREYSSLRGCREASFSHGGQLFVASVSQIIQVYDVWTGANRGILSGGTVAGHSSRVKQMLWSEDDTRLVSTASDGQFILWDMTSFVALKSSPLNVSFPNSPATSSSSSIFSLAMCAKKDFEGFYFACSDHRIREFDPHLQPVGITTDSEIASVTTLALTADEKFLVAGLDNGCVRVYSLPLSTTSIVSEVNVHSGAVTALISSPLTPVPGQSGLTHILSGSNDGTTFLLSFGDDSDVEAGAALSSQNEVWVEEIQVEREAYLETQNELLSLSEQIKTVDNQRVEGVESIKAESERKLKEIQNGHDMMIKSQTERQDQINTEMVQVGNQTSDEVKKIQRDYKESRTRLEQQTEKKLEQLEGTRIQVEKEKDENSRMWEEKMREQNKKHQTQLEELRRQYEKEISANEDQTYQLERQILEVIDKDDMDRLMSIDDVDVALLSLQQEMEDELQKKSMEKDESLRNKLEMDRVVAIKSQKLNDSKSKYEEKVLEFQTCVQMLDEVMGEIASLRKEIAEREDTISDKAFRIQDLKQKNQELDKFKFVLDWKIQELETKMEPKDREIKNLSEQIHDMDSELDTYATKKRSLELEISQAKLKLKGLDTELGTQRDRLATTKAYIKSVEDELHNSLAHLDDPKQLKADFVKIYTRFVIRNAPGQLSMNQPVIGAATSGFTLPPPMAKDIASRGGIGAKRAQMGGKKQGGQAQNVGSNEQREHERQRTHLERNVSKLKMNMEQSKSNHKGELARIMHENVALVKEINQLRRDIFNEEQKEKVLIEEKRQELHSQETNKKVKRSSTKSSSKKTTGEDSILLSSVQRELSEQKQELENLRNLVIEAEGLRRQEIDLMQKRMFGDTSQRDNASLRGSTNRPNTNSNRAGSANRLPPLPPSAEGTKSSIRRKPSDISVFEPIIAPMSDRQSPKPGSSRQMSPSQPLYSPSANLLGSRPGSGRSVHSQQSARSHHSIHTPHSTHSVASRTSQNGHPASERYTPHPPPGGSRPGSHAGSRHGSVGSRPRSNRSSQHSLHSTHSGHEQVFEEEEKGEDYGREDEGEYGREEEGEYLQEDGEKGELTHEEEEQDYSGEYDEGERRPSEEDVGTTDEGDEMMQEESPGDYHDEEGEAAGSTEVDESEPDLRREE
ncbi:putative cilia- and flagella-associated protein 57 [Blattamonas nauphoetae]|uniref:Cilia- and flagella-associated protein 57 n=1 Tax=Blattamonas nauphoetae TaxID=2049346 RepID=A0ABQ9YCH1_9EUKA|nr:putative cilia- and flagella-associated protein 57 [Blattamonas nauphoetae]